jgi:hypothetical protein
MEKQEESAESFIHIPTKQVHRSVQGKKIPDLSGFHPRPFTGNAHTGGVTAGSCSNGYGSYRG